MASGMLPRREYRPIGGGGGGGGRPTGRVRRGGRRTTAVGGQFEGFDTIEANRLRQFASPMLEVARGDAIRDRLQDITAAMSQMDTALESMRAEREPSRREEWGRLYGQAERVLDFLTSEENAPLPTSEMLSATFEGYAPLLKRHFSPEKLALLAYSTGVPATEIDRIVAGISRPSPTMPSPISQRQESISPFQNQPYSLQSYVPEVARAAPRQAQPQRAAPAPTPVKRPQPAPAQVYRATPKRGADGYVYKKGKKAVKSLFRFLTSGANAQTGGGGAF